MKVLTIWRNGHGAFVHEHPAGFFAGPDGRVPMTFTEWWRAAAAQRREHRACNETFHVEQILEAGCDRGSDEPA